MNFNGTMINEGAAIEYDVVLGASATVTIPVDSSTATVFVKDILFSNVADFSVLATPSAGSVAVAYSSNNANFYAFPGSPITANVQHPLTAPISASGDIEYLSVTTTGVTGATYVKVVFDAVFTFVGNAGGAADVVTVSNFPSTQTVSQSSAASLNATAFLGQPSTDGSTTVTTGGTAQNLFSGSTPTNGFAIYNPHASADLWISDSTTAAPNAAGSIRVVANGGGYETPAAYKPVGPISVYGASTGQPITAKKW